MEEFVQRKVIYEQPLNERMRTLMRLEFLFKQAQHFLRGESRWDSRSVVSTLLAIQELFMARSDLKGELIKELDRHADNLQGLQSNQNVDQERLCELLEELANWKGKLQTNTAQVGVHLRDSEFLNSIRQRSTIPGGSCDFDLPLYHNWLELPPETRIADLKKWMGGYEQVRGSIATILQLVRYSNTPVLTRVSGGTYQQNIPSGRPCQMVRIGIPPEADCYPEVSGGRHRFSVRLLRNEQFDERPVQVKEDRDIELTLCVI
jgi:cell division protein ZapD